MTICTCGFGPISGCRVCDTPPHAEGDTQDERATFLRWWNGEGAWSGSPCAVAYAGWLAAKADADDQLRALGHVERQRDQLAEAIQKIVDIANERDDVPVEAYNAIAAVARGDT
jgi:hypothetical protein